MKNQSTKSLAIGFILGAAAIFALGQSSAPPAPSGRYQVAGAGDNLNPSFVVIDTASGVAKLLQPNTRGGAAGFGVPFDQIRSSK